MAPCFHACADASSNVTPSASVNVVVAALARPCGCTFHAWSACATRSSTPPTVCISTANVASSAHVPRTPPTAASSVRSTAPMVPCADRGLTLRLSPLWMEPADGATFAARSGTHTDPLATTSGLNRRRRAANCESVAGFQSLSTLCHPAGSAAELVRSALRGNKLCSVAPTNGPALLSAISPANSCSISAATRASIATVASRSAATSASVAATAPRSAASRASTSAAASRAATTRASVAAAALRSAAIRASASATAAIRASVASRSAAARASAASTASRRASSNCACIIASNSSIDVAAPGVSLTVPLASAAASAGALATLVSKPVRACLGARSAATPSTAALASQRTPLTRYFLPALFIFQLTKRDCRLGVWGGWVGGWVGACALSGYEGGRRRPTNPATGEAYYAPQQRCGGDSGGGGGHGGTK